MCAAQTRPRAHQSVAALPINSVIDYVDDPYEIGAVIAVLRSTRDDPFAAMYLRGFIDPVQFVAGRMWQRYREKSEIGGIKAIDPTRLAVDGGRFKEPDISGLSSALVKLNQANNAMQAYEASIVHDVLVRHMSISQIAVSRSITSGRQIVYLMDRLRDALDTLAFVFGLTTVVPAAEQT